MPRIFVDGHSIEAPENANLLEVLLSNKFDMPYFCWHPSLGSVGACRQCAVVAYANEQDERGRVVMSCMTPVTEDARFSMIAGAATDFRDAVIENLMLNHPHDCPVCEEGGECHLQDMTIMVGHGERRYEGRKTTFINQYLGPFIGHEMNRCITCYRCVRYYQDYAGGSDLSAFGSRDRVYFGRSSDGVLENEFAGNLVEVCPTGVFTDKTLSKHYTRKWDLQSAPTICQGCSLGCNTYTSERYGELRRIHNRYHSKVNSYFLCDRGRFGAQFVNSPRRIPSAGLLNSEGKFDAVPLARALDEVRARLKGRVVGIGSPRASLESNAALRLLVGPDCYANGMTTTDRQMHRDILDVLASRIVSPSMADAESYDAILVVGEDVTNHAPRLALSIRQAVRNRGRALAADLGIAEWHDAAVRELTQDQLSPLIVLSPMADRLDDVAQLSCRFAPEDIVSFTEGITRSLDSYEPGTEKNIADLLLSARKPLIVSGTSLGSVNVIRAAANLAAALFNRNKETGILLCAGEANSLGVALLDNDNDVADLLKERPAAVIVLENDLLTRFDADLLQGIDHLVVLDCLDNATASAASVVLPAATFAESEGTWVNNEGRVQRSMAAYKPKGDISAAYTMLSALAGSEASATWLQSLIADQHPVLRAVRDCAPDEKFRAASGKVARMTHRSSGRTAMHANVSVHEPQQPLDDQSALAFSMEGDYRDAPSTLRAFSWSPGWNSNQSIHKFQSEVGGPDSGGIPGVRLFEGVEDPKTFELIDEAPGNLIGQHHIFGSDGPTGEAMELATLVPGLYAKMNSETALLLGVRDRDGIGALGFVMTVLIREDIADNCVVYPLLPGTARLSTATLSMLKRVDGHSPPPDPMRPALIATDRTASGKAGESA